MLVDTIEGRVNLSLSLTVASGFVSYLSLHVDPRDVLKISVLVVLLIEFVGSAKSIAGKIGLQDGYEMIRGLSVLVFVQLVLNEIKPLDVNRVSDTMQIGIVGSIVRLDIPLTYWPTIESFFVLSLSLMGITFISRYISTYSKDVGSVAPPEVQRIVTGIQYMFADSISPMISDYHTQRILAFLGIVFMRAILRNMSRKEVDMSSLKILSSGIGMAWFNLIIKIIVPDERWSTLSLIEVTAALCMSMIFQAFQGVVEGFSSLKGYIEWHLSNVISRSAISEGVSVFEISLISSAISYILMNERNSKDNVSASRTLFNISAIVLANTVANWCISYIKNSTSIDSLTILVVSIILTKGIYELYKHSYPSEEGSGKQL